LQYFVVVVVVVFVIFFSLSKKQNPTFQKKASQKQTNLVVEAVHKGYRKRTSL
jgi:F0F1-type ATP synthase membrane subunit a